MSKRVWRAVFGGAALGVVVAALAASALAASSTAAHLTVHSTEFGKAVFGPNGKVVYVFGADRGSTSHCYGACAAAWPPVTTSSARIAVDGAAAGSLTGEITRAGGVHQLTYAGHPLYRFAGDSSPGATNGQGSEAFGARWDVLTPAGQEVTGG